MDEITRQEYLNNMGIQSYFPRYVLPAAKPSIKCDWPETLEQEAKIKVEIKKPIQNEPIITSKTVPELDESTNIAPTQSPNDSDTDEVRFQLAIIHVNEEILALILLPYMYTNNSLSSIQKQLFINIFNSLNQGAVNLNLEIKPFRWPFSESPHMKKDAHAAKEALGAYLEQLKGKFTFNRIIVMGEKITPFVETAESYELTSCRSLDEMLKMPQLKREVWQQLKKQPNIN